MSKYREICEAASNAGKSWINYRDASWKHISDLVNGFVRYCEIPLDRVAFWCWNERTDEERSYLPAEEGKKYTMFGATKFDRSDRCWHLAVCITLSEPGPFEEWAAFLLCVTDAAGKAMARVGLQDKLRQIDLGDPSQCNQFYDDIVKALVEAFRGNQTPGPKTIGFTAG